MDRMGIISLGVAPFTENSVAKGHWC